ncbi:12154_t:CDS:2, partial [Gigaspora rosea]
DSNANEFWEQFEKKQMLKRQQYNTNVDIQLSTLKVMSTSASYQGNELSKQMELLSENDKNRKRPNNDCIEQENPKFYKIDETDDDVKMNDS